MGDRTWHYEDCPHCGAKNSLECYEAISSFSKSDSCDKCGYHVPYEITDDGHNQMDRLNEIIAQTKEFKRQFDEYETLQSNQTVMGKERGVCSICGFCPDALLQELIAAKAALSPPDQPREGDTTDAKK